MKSIIVESNEPNGPFGAKEVGEGAIMPVIPAILNALYDATGVRIYELPLTPERVYTALGKRGRYQGVTREQNHEKKAGPREALPWLEGLADS
jgi:hypothetical protein